MKSLIKVILSTLLSSIFIACSSNKSTNEESADLSSDTTPVATLPAAGSKLTKAASINFKVGNVYETAQRVNQAAKSLNGLVMNSDIRSEEESSKQLEISTDSVQQISSYRITADMTVRVPSESLDIFMDQIANSATIINHSKLDIEDKSLQYLSSHLKQRNRRQFIEEEKDKRRKVNESLSVLGEKDAATDLQIANKQIDMDVQYSTVQLSFFQNALVRRETIANTNLDSYKLPFAKNIASAFVDGWSYFLAILIVITHLWAFILAGLLGYFAFRYYKVRKAIS